MTTLYTKLVGFWKLDDIPVAGGTAWDHSGRTNHLANAITNGGVVTTDGAAVFTDGNNLRAQHPQHDQTLDGGDEFTWCADVKFDSVATQQTIMGVWDGGSNNRSRALTYYGGTGKIASFVSTDGTGGTAVNVQSNAVITTDTWYHVQMWCDGTNLGVSVDGVETTTAFSSSPFYSADAPAFRIGYTSTFLNFLGSIKNVCFWRRALDSGERAAVAGGSLPDSQLDDKLNVVLVLGQSNARGLARANLLDGPDETHYRFDTIVYNGTNSYYPSWAPTAPEYRSTNDNDFGPELGMAEVLGSGWGILKYGENSTGAHPDLDQWYPGDAVHTAAIARIAIAMAELVAAGYTPIIRAIVWAAGEKDAETEAHALAYETSLTALVTDLRSRYGDLPFIVVKNSTLQTQKTYISTVMSQTDSFATNVDNVTVIDPGDFGVCYDNLHWDESSQLRIGRLVGEAIVESPTEQSLDTILSAINSLNDLSSAEAQAAATAALNDYDPPTYAEFEDGINSLGDSITSAHSTTDAAIAALNDLSPETAAEACDAALTAFEVDGILLEVALSAILATAAGKATITDNGTGTYTITFTRQDGETAALEVTYSPTTGARASVATPA